MFDRTAGAIRGRCSRVCNVVSAEMFNYAPGPYTDRVMETVIELRDRSEYCIWCAVVAAADVDIVIVLVLLVAVVVADLALHRVVIVYWLRVDCKWAYTYCGIMMWDRQPHLSAIVQTWHFSLFGHIAWMPDKTDSKKILTASLLENWRRPPGRPHVDDDYPAGPEIQ